MNLSLQMVRGLGALAMCAAVSVYALTLPMAMTGGSKAAASDTNGFGVAVAHSRLEIVVVSAADNTPRYQVASIRVGKPEPLAAEPARRTVMRARFGNVHS
jgi:hypothetical protein